MALLAIAALLLGSGRAVADSRQQLHDRDGGSSETRTALMPQGPLGANRANLYSVPGGQTFGETRSVAAGFLSYGSATTTATEERAHVAQSALNRGASHGYDDRGAARGTVTTAAPAFVAAKSGNTSLKTAAKSCSVNSFTGDTPVLMADGTTRPIRDVKVGDLVLATDPETGETGARPVSNVIVHGGKHTMVDVTLADGTTISATDRHPFWNATTGRFTYAIDLKPGQQVLAADGTLLAIIGIRVYDEDLTAYNLTVEGIHTYYAGDTPVLVHNSCDVPGRPFTGRKAPAQAYEHLQEFHGLDPHVASNRLHVLKEQGGLGAADDVVIGRTGDVYDGRTGERLGSLTDPNLGRTR